LSIAPVSSAISSGACGASSQRRRRLRDLLHHQRQRLRIKEGLLRRVHLVEHDAERVHIRLSVDARQRLALLRCHIGRSSEQRSGARSVLVRGLLSQSIGEELGDSEVEELHPHAVARLLDDQALPGLRSLWTIPLLRAREDRGQIVKDPESVRTERSPGRLARRAQIRR
jgi:hypothetical protein